VSLDNKKHDQSDENQATEQLVDKTRRSFTRLGVVAPVIMTMASRPVFGAQCLSDILSTMQSHAPTSNCWGGLSPGFWRQANGKVNVTGEDAKSAWNTAVPGYNPSAYGTLKLVCYKSDGTTRSCKAIKPGDYQGGAPYSITGLAGTGLAAGFASTPIREILINNSGDDFGFHYLAAWLNIQYAAHVSGVQYFLTMAQFEGLVAGTILLPTGYTDLISLLKANYDQFSTTNPFD